MQATQAERAKNMDRTMRRITFEIDDDVLAHVERYARAVNISVERILKELDDDCQAKGH
jgi:hypothetical protein